MAKTFHLKSEVVVTYEHTVHCDTYEEAVQWVEDQQDDGVEVDSTAPKVIRHDP